MKKSSKRPELKNTLPDGGEAPPTRFLVFPIARLANAKGRNLPRRLLKLGEPVIEAAGVPGRRIMFAHAFTPEHIQDLTDIAAEYGVSISQILFNAPPDDWRRPPSTVPV